MDATRALDRSLPLDDGEAFRRTGEGQRPIDTDGRAETAPKSRTAAHAVDARQDELMAIESSEGRPPSHGQRMSGWKWLAILIPVLVVGSGAVAMVNGATASDLLKYGIVFALLLLIGGLPRWAASLSRGKEEATARREAVAELRTDAPAPTRAQTAEP